MRPARRRPASLSAFTLLELLIVVAVILALAGLLFPVIGSVQERARKTQAASDASQVVTAINAYYAEYGKYPLKDDKQGYDTVFGNPSPLYNNNAVFDILRARSTTNNNPQNAFNPKQVVYFEGKQAKDTTDPRGGFLAKSGDARDGRYYDPWGSEYVIFIDGDYDGAMNFYGLYTDWPSPPDSNALRLSVGVSSIGPDKKMGKNGNYTFKGSDDVASWQ